MVFSGTKKLKKCIKVFRIQTSKIFKHFPVAICNMGLPFDGILLRSVIIWLRSITVSNFAEKIPLSSPTTVCVAFSFSYQRRCQKIRLHYLKRSPETDFSAQDRESGRFQANFQILAVVFFVFLVFALMTMLQ